MKKRKLIELSNIKKLYSTLKLSEKFAVHIILFLLLISIASILISVSNRYLVSLPKSGGEINEGIIGTPRFINPIFAERDVDRDLTSLIYSGLLRRNSNGELINDIAESYEVSDDGTKYTFTLKEGLTFHDGRPISADDVVFTLESIQNGETKSIEQRNWVDILVEKINDRTVTFILPDAYTPFIENLTIGILPKHIWSRTGLDEMLFSTYNIEPVGSGPFMISSVKRSSNKDIERYTLIPFREFALGDVFLDRINISFFKDQEDLDTAYKKGSVDTTIYATEPEHFIQTTRSESFALFFNQNKSSLLAKAYIREAINTAIDTEKLVNGLFSNNAEALSGPVPSQISPIEYIENAELIENTEEVREILEEAGWVLNDEGLYEDDGETIKITISTNDSETLLKTGKYIESQLRELGFDIALEIYEENDLLQRVIRPRNFEILLFGTVINHGLDMYGFWHSSQRNDPGVNITQYANIDVDGLVSKLRSEQDQENRDALYKDFEGEILKDRPAVFLYARKIKYAIPENLIVNIPLSVVQSSERFQMIHTWHIEKDEVWPIFNK